MLRFSHVCEACPASQASRRYNEPMLCNHHVDTRSCMLCANATLLLSKRLHRRGRGAGQGEDTRGVRSKLSSTGCLPTPKTALAPWVKLPESSATLYPPAIYSRFRSKGGTGASASRFHACRWAKPFFTHRGSRITSSNPIHSQAKLSNRASRCSRRRP